MSHQCKCSILNNKTTHNNIYNINNCFSQGAEVKGACIFYCSGLQSNELHRLVCNMRSHTTSKSYNDNIKLKIMLTKFEVGSSV